MSSRPVDPTASGISSQMCPRQLEHNKAQSYLIIYSLRLLPLSKYWHYSPSCSYQESSSPSPLTASQLLTLHFFCCLHTSHLHCLYSGLASSPVQLWNILTQDSVQESLSCFLRENWDPIIHCIYRYYFTYQGFALICRNHFIYSQ